MQKPTLKKAVSPDKAKAIGALLKRIRNEKGLSAEDVADGANVARRSYADWEAGKSLPKLEGFQSLARFHKAHISDWLEAVGL